MSYCKTVYYYKLNNTLAVYKSIVVSMYWKIIFLVFILFKITVKILYQNQNYIRHYSSISIN